MRNNRDFALCENRNRIDKVYTHTLPSISLPFASSEPTHTTHTHSHYLTSSFCVQWADLRHVRNLRVLLLSGTTLTDQCISDLAASHSHTLERLSVAACQQYDDPLDADGAAAAWAMTLEALPQLLCLTWLDVSCLPLAADTVAMVASLPSLQFLGAVGVGAPAPTGLSPRLVVAGTATAAQVRASPRSFLRAAVLVRVKVNFTVKNTGCEESLATAYGVFDCEFDFGSHEWSCSKSTTSKSTKSSDNLGLVHPFAQVRCATITTISTHAAIAQPVLHALFQLLAATPIPAELTHDEGLTMAVVRALEAFAHSEDVQLVATAVLFHLTRPSRVQDQDPRARRRALAAIITVVRELRQSGSEVQVR